MNSKLKVISEQWDLISNERFETLRNKDDHSYEEILKPVFLNYVKKNNVDNILDVGCGLGFVTKELSKYTKKITGLDISNSSLQLATLYNKCENTIYIHTSIEDFETTETFDLIISNMVLMDMPDVENALRKIYDLLKPASSFLFTITHPSFWPIYWKYSEERDFKYNNHIEIIADFKIKDKVYKDFKTSHFHRPISYYLNLAVCLGFKFHEMTELFDYDRELWYPKFLLIELKK